MYYQVVKDGTIIDAVENPVYCKYFDRSRAVLRCDEKASPQGIVSERTGCMYQVDGWETFPDGTEYSGTVTLTEIDEATYRSLTEVLDAGTTPEEPEIEEASDDSEVSDAFVLQQLSNMFGVDPAEAIAQIKEVMA